MAQLVTYRESLARSGNAGVVEDVPVGLLEVRNESAFETSRFNRGNLLDTRQAGNFLDRHRDRHLRVLPQDFGNELLWPREVGQLYKVKLHHLPESSSS